MSAARQSLWTLPNVLTMSRVALVPALVGSFYLPYDWAPWVGLGLFILAGVTDWLDGQLARAMDSQTRFGAFLDPIADKLLVAAALLMLAAFDRMDQITLIAAVIILCREILVSGLREFLAELQVGMPVTRLAKYKTVAQMVALGFLLAGPVQGVPVVEIGTGLLWLAALLTVITGYTYLRAGMAHMTGAP